MAFRGIGEVKVYKGEIIDAHMHLWDLDVGDYPWLNEREPFIEELIGDYKKLRQSFLLSDFLNMIKNLNVTKSVHVEANANPKKALQETIWLQKLADTYGHPHGIVAFADLRDPDIENVLKDQCQYPNVRGIRQVLFHHEGSKERDLLTDPHWQRGLKAMAANELTFDLALLDHQLEAASKVVKEYSDVCFILNHLGWPREISDAHFPIWKERLAQFAENPNTYLKISGFGIVLQKNDAQEIKKYARAGLEIFGEDRCFFSSDFPPDGLFLSYHELFHAIKLAFSDLSEQVQTKLFYSNAKKVYQL